MATTLTSDLGRFTAGLHYDDIPREAVTLIKTAFTDCVGVTIAGAQHEGPRILEATLRPAPGPATVLFSERTASAPDAAWINGMAAHVLDFDDFARLGGHPSAVLVPAILATGQAMGASGKELICAYAAGFETWTELLRRERDVHHNKGWHPTGIFGAIGSAACCAYLRRLDPEQTAATLGLAGSQSAGLVANFGTMTKSFHAGRAAHSGAISAELAQNGFTAAGDALEHPAGFLAAVSPAGNIDLASVSEAGKVWKLMTNRLAIKKYPTCFATHRALDGMIELAKTHNIASDDVRQVEVSLSKRGIAILRHHLPQTALESKFSMEFAMACALIAQRAGLRQLTDEFARRHDVQALMKRVVLVPMPDEEADSRQPGFSAYDRVKILTASGDLIDSGPIKAVRGDPDFPLTRDELWTKFEDCVAFGNVGVDTRELFESLMALDQIERVTHIPGLGRRI